MLLRMTWAGPSTCRISRRRRFNEAGAMLLRMTLGILAWIAWRVLLQ